jgi:[ribosomal protein S5]-alanine N-acetyltransferase
MSGRVVRSFVFSIITAMQMPEQLFTDRLILRMPHMEDASIIFEGWAQDLEVVHYLPWRPHGSVEETKSFVQSCLSDWDTRTGFPYMMILRENNEVLGMIDARIHLPQMGIGYCLARVHWGKGYMPEAARAVIDWAFQQPSIHRVYATTDVDNVASQHVLEKVGMQREGLLRKYIIHPNISDIPRDSYMYAITK